MAREASARGAPTGGRRKTIKTNFPENPLEFSESSQKSPFPIKLREEQEFEGLSVKIKICKNKIWNPYEISHLTMFYFSKIEQILDF